MIKGPKGFLTGLRIQRKDSGYILFYKEGRSFRFIHHDKLTEFPELGPTCLVEWSDD